MKVIKETFEHKVAGHTVKLTANNNKSHMLNVSSGIGIIALNANDLKKLSKFLSETADKIIADDDYSN